MNTYLLIFVILLLLIPVVLLVLYYTDNKYKEYKMLFIGISITIITTCVIIFAASYRTYRDRTNFCELKYDGIDYEFVKEKIFEIDSAGNRNEIIDNDKIIDLDKEYLRRMTNTVKLPIIIDINNDRTNFINKYSLYTWYENLKSSYGLSTKPLSDDNDEYNTVPDYEYKNNDD